MSLQDELNKILPYDKKSEDAYTKSLRSLLPKGVIWGFLVRKIVDFVQDNIVGNAQPFQDNTPGQSTYQDISSNNATRARISSLFGNLISVFAKEIHRFQAAWYDLYTQSIPGLSTELLTDWERNLGLPDSCTINPSTITIEERQCDVQLKLYSDNSIGLSKTFYTEYALNLGYGITFTEQLSTSEPFRLSGVGDSPTDYGSQFIVPAATPSFDGSQFSSSEPVFVTVNINTGNNYPDSIARFQCKMFKLFPSHTKISWNVNI